jgi:hypothetical protein
LHSEIVNHGCYSSISSRSIDSIDCKNWNGIEFIGYRLKFNVFNQYETIINLKESFKGIYKNIYLNNMNNEFKGEWNKRDSDSFQLLADRLGSDYYHVSEWQKIGDEGGKGGNGGKCGVAGKEGYMGELILAEKKLSKTQPITFNVEDQVRPKIMFDCSGNPGLGGKNGDTAIKYYEYKNNNVGTKISSFGLAAIGIGGNWVNGVDETWPSYERGISGTRATEPIILNQIDPEKSNLNIYKLQNDYIYFLSEIKNDDTRSKIVENSLSKFLKIQTPTPPVNDLIERVIILYKNKKLDTFYPVVLEQLLNITKDNNNELNQNEDYMLDYLISYLKSFQLRFSSVEDILLVVDLKSFITQIKSDIQSLNEIKQEVIRTMFQSSFEDKLKVKIDESNALVENLKLEIENTQIEINKKLVNVIEKIRNMRNETAIHSKQLEEEKTKLEETLRLKSLFGGLEIAAQALSLLGPKGALVGNLAQTCLNIGRTVSGQQRKNSNVLVPTNTDKIVNDLADYLRNKNQVQLKSLEKDLKIAETNKHITNLDLSKKIDKHTIGVRIEKLPDSREKYTLILKHSQYMLSSSNLSTADKQKYEKKYEDIKEWLERQQNFLKDGLAKGVVLARTAQAAFDLYSDIKMSEDEIEMIQNEIGKNIEKHKKMYDMEQEINIYQTGLLKNSQDELTSFNNNLQNKSKISLEIIKHSVTKTLSEMKSTMMDLVGSFESGIGKSSDISTTIHRIEHSTTTLISIYSLIQGYIEQNEFANYVNSLHLSVGELDLPKEYRANFNNLKKLILENLVKERYEKAEMSFRFWSFPFFEQHQLNLKFGDSDQIESLISFYSQNLDYMLNKIIESDNTINSIDHSYQKYVFDYDTPFYEWSSGNYPIAFKHLLKGQNVKFYADVSKSDKFEAVKLNKVYIKIMIKSSSKLNETLNKLLEECFVDLTYSDISYFSYKNEIHKIESIGLNQNFTFRYRYGHPNDKNYWNRVYKKIENSKPMLSPYTLWDIRIRPMNKDQNEIILKDIFNIYEQISNQDDAAIYLCGNGQYIQS